MAMKNEMRPNTIAVAAAIPARTKRRRHAVGGRRLVMLRSAIG